MKRSFLFLLISHLVVFGELPLMRDVITSAELAKLKAPGPMAQFEPATGPDPALIAPPKDLIASSDFLCFNGMATLVPKRAILHRPPEMERRLKFLPGSSVVSWFDFYKANQGWVTTVEVTRAQAEGKVLLDPEVLDGISKNPNVVVAVYREGPISVMPPAPDPPPEVSDPVSKP